MPIDIELQNPQGAVIETLTDLADFLHRTLPYYDDMTLRLLNTIDWYGDTEFDSTQIPVLLEELDRIMPPAADAEQEALLQRLKRILIRCGTAPG